LAQYPADQISIDGDARRYARATDEGHVFETFFCSTCGATVYAKAGKHPTLTLVAVGAIADPTFQMPARSVWEESMHHWVVIPNGLQHFSQGRG
jgi:hypothetical protein